MTNTTLENTPPLPAMVALDVPPIIEKLSKAIDSLASGKASGSNNIPPEVAKAANESSLLQHLHELLLQCWKEGAAPQDMRDAKIITLYRNKGERSDCNNYRGISLLSIVGTRPSPVWFSTDCNSSLSASTQRRSAASGLPCQPSTWCSQ